jgi:hypothetical protein
MPRRFLVSVHVPKTAGTSLLKEIRRGVLGRPLLDYDDRPASTGPIHDLRRLAASIGARMRRGQLLRDYDVVHGHFHVRKYLFLRDDADFIIFLREPVARTLSAFYYLKYIAAQNPHTAARNPLIPLVTSGRLDLVEFARSPHAVHLYRDYMAGLDLEDFALVGISERYDESLALLNRMRGTRLAEQHERRGGYTRHEDEYRPLLPELAKANEENMDVYRRGVELFEKRLSSVRD